MTMRMGVVAQTNPQDMSVDVVMLDNGARLTGVQMVTGFASPDRGDNEMPVIKPGKDKWEVRNDNTQTKAIIGMVNNNPVCLGFMPPQVNQIAFEDGRWMKKTESDFYMTASPGADFEMVHPSGWYMKVGESPDKTELTGKNFDKNFRTDRNTGKKLFTRIYAPNGAAVLTIDPDGNAVMDFKGDYAVNAENITMTARQKATIKGGNKAELLSDSSAVVDAPDVDIGL